MSRIVLAVTVGLVLTAGVRADNKENIAAAKAALATLEKSKEAKERAAAVATLGKVAAAGQYEAVKPGIPTVVEALDDKDAGVRAAAALAIGQIGPDDPEPVVKKLAELLKDKDDKVKTNAVKALGSFGEKASSAVKALKEAKKEDGDPKSKFSRDVEAAIKTIQPRKPKQ